MDKNQKLEPAYELFGVQKYLHNETTVHLSQRFTTQHAYQT